jgi:F-type H+-transporting ATPase subunit a
MTTPAPLAAKDIGDEIGHHIVIKIGGLAFNLDTIYATVLAAVIVLGLGFWLRSKVTSGVPSRLQLIWEGVVNQVESQVQEQIGPTAPFVVPLAIALFMFILVANWIELTPINIVEELSRPVTLALRLFGNIFSGTIMLLLIGLFPSFIVPFPNAVWKLFDMFIGVIQAFIFALLTILYFSGAVETEESH